MSLPVPDYELRARPLARILGYRLVRTTLAPDTTLYGRVEYAVWSEVSADALERKYWYEVSFKPLGTKCGHTWTASWPTSDGQVNRLCFSVVERMPAHHEGACKVAKLGPIGHVRMWPRSVGLGTHLRDQLIAWVADNHPDASVARGKLSPRDADPDNLERRSRFYLAAKFEVSITEEGAGAFWADRVDGLNWQSQNQGVFEVTPHELCTILKSVGELERALVTQATIKDQCRQLAIEVRRWKSRAWLLAALGAAGLAYLLRAAALGSLS